MRGRRAWPVRQEAASLGPHSYGLGGRAECGGERPGNCVDLTRPSPACYELVRVNGVQVKMTFPQSGNPRPAPGAEVNNFYVLAPQTDEPQGTLPSNTTTS